MSTSLEQFAKMFPYGNNPECMNKEIKALSEKKKQQPFQVIKGGLHSQVINKPTILK